MAHAKRLLITETDPDYQRYLKKTISNVSLTHGGYFSKDNSDSDEKIENEINEILHDKESLLDLNNPRRFIFSKWTLREGWDNPNVFQICKIRSSGSQTSKLQEVGRGLRLPVNEYMQRLTDQNFYLHYYVDFSEVDFADQLIKEINQSAGSVGILDHVDKLTDELIQQVIALYPDQTSDQIKETLGELDAISFSGKFKPNGIDIFKAQYPKIVQNTINPDRIRKGNDKTKQHKTKMRIAKYDELRSLWETINQKVVLQYNIDNEAQFLSLLESYFEQNQSQFKVTGVTTIEKQISIQHNLAVLTETESTDDDILPISTLSYQEFLFELADRLKVNVLTLHQVLIKIQPKTDINQYLSRSTIRQIKAGFDQFLLANSFATFQVAYQAVTNTVHPTRFTDATGKPFPEIDASQLGVQHSATSAATNYLFEDVFFDSVLEYENIIKNISSVTVFTKIPKNSIKIPVAGGASYSPDFAYVVDYADGTQRLNLVVETKGKDEIALSREEQQKIKHAEKLFKQSGHLVDVRFETQFSSTKIIDLIKNVMKSEEGRL